MRLVVLCLAPSSACGALHKIRQDGLSKPGGAPRDDSQPPNFGSPELPHQIPDGFRSSTASCQKPRFPALGVCTVVGPEGAWRVCVCCLGPMRGMGGGPG